MKRCEKMSSKCDGFAESTPLTVCQDTGAFPDLASPTPAPFFIPPVPFDGQSACMSALVLLISLSHVRLLPTPPRPISPALRPFPFLSTVSHRPSPIVHRRTCNQNTTAIRTTEPGILLLRDTRNRQSERSHPNKATTSHRAIPGVHRQLERRADSTPEIFESTSTDSTVPQPLLVTTHLGDVQEGLECPRRELIGRSRVVRESNKHRTLHRHDPPPTNHEHNDDRRQARV